MGGRVGLKGKGLPGCEQDFGLQEKFRPRLKILTLIVGSLRERSEVFKVSFHGRRFSDGHGEIIRVKAVDQAHMNSAYFGGVIVQKAQGREGENHVFGKL